MTRTAAQRLASSVRDFQYYITQHHGWTGTWNEPGMDGIYSSTMQMPEDTGTVKLLIDDDILTVIARDHTGEELSRATFTHFTMTYGATLQFVGAVIEH